MNICTRLDHFLSFLKYPTMLIKLNWLGAIIPFWDHLFLIFRLSLSLLTFIIHNRFQDGNQETFLILVSHYLIFSFLAGTGGHIAGASQLARHIHRSAGHCCRLQFDHILHLPAVARGWRPTHSRTTHAPQRYSQQKFAVEALQRHLEQRWVGKPQYNLYIFLSYTYQSPNLQTTSSSIAIQRAACPYSTWPITQRAFLWPIPLLWVARVPWHYTPSLFTYFTFIVSLSSSLSLFNSAN